MEYISTRNSEKIFFFKDVFLRGLAPDGGLFIPKKIPFYNSQELKKIKSLSYEELATEILLKFVGDEFSEKEISDIVKNSYKNFRVKNVVKVIKLGNIDLLELFHGPTLAFKDIAMQVIGNMYEHILKKYNLKANVVVATSGDTGAAAIDAIKNRKNIKIFVLHPDKKISDVQRKFMTTVDSNNVFNIALSSNFDECQSFVKSMFADKNFSNSINMTGVNSINWFRIAIQIVYYFFSYFKIADGIKKINYSVPTGNFGDVYAGYIAKKMGLPINKLIIATNENDILKKVVNSGIYKSSKVVHTISPSMDIQIASNFERLIFDVCSQDSKKISSLMKDFNVRGEYKLEEEEIKKIKEDFSAESLSEKETKLIIKDIYFKEKILIDPHTAVAIGANNKIALTGKNIILATAHPSKFYNTVVKETGIKPELPENLKDILLKKEKYEKLPKDLKVVQKYILKNI